MLVFDQFKKRRFGIIANETTFNQNSTEGIYKIIDIRTALNRDRNNIPYMRLQKAPDMKYNYVTILFRKLMA